MVGGRYVLRYCNRPGKIFAGMFSGDVSRYIEFLLYRQEQDRMAPLIESDEVFEQKMEQGYADAMEGRVRPLEDVFSVKTTF